jgi:hypothetical protein
VTVAPDFDPALGMTLRTARRLLAHTFARVPRSAAAELGIDLSDFAGASLSGDEQRELFTAGPLYLAAQLESAGLNEAVDAMAGLYISGALPLARGTAANRFADLWEHRHTRFTAAERAALFARIFGDAAPTVMAGNAPVNSDFRSLLIDLVHILARSGADPGYGSAVIRQAVDDLARNLAPRLSSTPEMSAHELLDGLEAALALFREPDVQRAVQANNARMAVTTAVQRFVGPRVSLDIALDRGGTGQVLLGWVATVAAAPARPSLTVPEPIIEAAAAWARATLQAMPAGSGS